MKKIKAFLTSILFLALLTACTAKPAESTAAATSTPAGVSSSTNENPNPTPFVYPDWVKTGTWLVYPMEGGEANGKYNKDMEMEITITNFGRQIYSVQLNHRGIEIVEGAEYEISFEIYAEKPQKGEYAIQQDYNPYDPYYKIELDITTERQTITDTFVASATDDSISMVFNLGMSLETNIDTNVVCINNATFKCLTDLGPSTKNVKNVLVNQTGFYPNSVKTAVLRGDAVDTEFKVVNVETEEVLYTGTVGEAKDNASSDEKCAVIDFTELTTPGKYKIVTENHGESYEFVISSTAYKDLYNGVVEMLYTQRCGCEVKGGSYLHAACHTDLATVYGTTTKIDVSGGWHDAGDYGKYVVPAAKTVEDLLLAYSLYGDNFFYTVDIPEKTNTIPDILDEAIYELDWMLKMQASTGEVYHKVSSYQFPGADLPAANDNLAMVVSPVSYAATADFAAVMAKASAIIKAFDETKANEYKKAAIKAYDALASMSKTTFKNPTDIGTGEYPDSDLDDEYLWASSELYALTNEAKYKTNFNSVYQTSKATITAGFGWDNMGGYALYTMYKKDANSEILTSLTKTADAYKTNIDMDAYNSCMIDLFCWGSNLTICNAAQLFLLLSDLGENTYIAYIQKEVDYLLGMNTTEYSFVTGFGTKTPVHPHHRPSVATGQAVPGMLVGGPNNDFENNGGDATATSKLRGNASAAGSYIDNAQAWSINEVTIYWNSPLILILSQIIAANSVQ